MEQAGLSNFDLTIRPSAATFFHELNFCCQPENKIYSPSRSAVHVLYTLCLCVRVSSFLSVCLSSVVTACHTVCNCLWFLSISLSMSLPVSSAVGKFLIFLWFTQTWGNLYDWISVCNLCSCMSYLWVTFCPSVRPYTHLTWYVFNSLYLIAFSSN